MIIEIDSGDCPSMTIRPALLADAVELAAMEATCFSEPWTLKAIQKALEDEKYVFLLLEIEVENEKSSQGYVFGWNVGDEAELARVGVLPQMRGQGAGKKLLLGLTSAFKLRGVLDVFLEVRVGNLVAKKLYENVGFENVGSRPRYYADGEDAIVMRLNLQK